MFENLKKTTEKHPDFYGDFMGLDGVIYQIAGWKKLTNGKKFLSLKISPKQEKQQAPPKPQSSGW